MIGLLAQMGDRVGGMGSTMAGGALVWILVVVVLVLLIALLVKTLRK